MSASPPPPPPSPPPPPPPPPEEQSTSSETNTQKLSSGDLNPELQIKIQKAAAALETSRALHAEQESALHFAATLLSFPNGLPHKPGSHNSNNASAANGGTDVATGINPDLLNNGITEFVSGGVQDAWLALMQKSTTHDEDKDNEANSTAMEMVPDSTTMNTGTTTADSEFEYPLTKGQLAKAAKTTALATSLQRATQLAQQQCGINKEEEASSLCVDALHTISNATLDKLKENLNETSNSTTPDWFMQAFQDKVQEIRTYHARNDTTAISDVTGSTSGRMIEYTPDYMIPPSPSNKNTPASLLQPPAKRRRRNGNPIADGYDLYSILSSELQNITSGQMFSVEEVMGKYLDLQGFHDSVISTPALNALFTIDEDNSANTNTTEDDNKLSYADFVMILLKSTSSATTSTTSTTSSNKTLMKLPEQVKLSYRKKYIRLLSSMQTYLISFINRTSPLLVLEEAILKPAMEEFDKEWSLHGGVLGWERKLQERILVQKTESSNGNKDGDDQPKKEGIDLKQYLSVEELMKEVSAEELKIELARLGMKCGGMPLDRAKRLWRSRDTPLDKLPGKLFVKKRGGVGTNNNGKNENGKAGGETKAETVVKDNTTTGESSVVDGMFGTSNQRRVDIARLEYIVIALLDQLRPMLDATARRAERRLTQTFNEKEREMQEEINGTFSTALEGTGDNAGEDANDDEKKGSDEEEDSDDEEDVPIYNPKGVPLGWDGKPIPYWLFKLHGLNHFYPCEICGNISYRGRRNFEKHFTETKHTYGMKCLGIPNTKHFHGVTKIADAQALWAKLEHMVNKDIFDGAKEEEYEDSHGNVLSRATYEDLARQGML